MRRLLRFFSRIWIRLLAFNLLLVFLPALGIVFLEAYETRLLKMQEDSMAQQGRLLAAALGEQGPIDPESAKSILRNLRRQLTARLRVYDCERQVLADSSQLGPKSEGNQEPPPPAEATQSWIYRLGRGIYRLVNRPEPASAGGRAAAAAIENACGGTYGSTVRQAPDGASLIIDVALPIRSDGEVQGAVAVSKSTVQILTALYELRLDAFKVVLASVAVAVLLSLLVATTIERPVNRLSHQARAMLDRRGRLRGGFRASGSQDEIGDLSRALAKLTERLEGHIRFIESFASDVSHEFKNPLASIRNATELAAEIDDPEERRRFTEMALNDVARLEHLLSDVREITQLDTELEERGTEKVPIVVLLRGLVEQLELRGLNIELRCPAEDALHVEAVPERLVQVFENLLDNAASFSPADEPVEVEVEGLGKSLRVRVLDRGPGIPEEHRQRIFDRFFSYRPDSTESRGNHSGLGLAIVKAIVESYGGSIDALDRDGGGTVLQVQLPSASS